MNNNRNSTIFVNGKPIGKVSDEIFNKIIVGSRHLLQKPLAIALSITSLKDAEAAGAKALRITDIESGLIYNTTINHFHKYSFPLKRGNFELQKALPLEYWDVTAGKITRQVKKNKNENSQETRPEEEPELIPGLNYTPMQLHFDIFRNYRK